MIINFLNMDTIIDGGAIQNDVFATNTVVETLWGNHLYLCFEEYESLSLGVTPINKVAAIYLTRSCESQLRSGEKRYYL